VDLGPPIYLPPKAGWQVQPANRLLLLLLLLLYYYYYTNNESTVHPRQPPPSSSVAAIVVLISGMTAGGALLAAGATLTKLEARLKQNPSESRTSVNTLRRSNIYGAPR
jgi:hypothetical protein